MFWSILTVDADLVERRHTSFLEMTKTFITDNKEYENISGWKNVYIYVSSEVVDYVFSTMTITTSRCTISHNVLLLTERVRSNCLLQILWTISTIDADLVERRHNPFAEIPMSWFAAS